MKRMIINFDPKIQDALLVKAAQTNRTVSDLVNDAVRNALADDSADLAAFRRRAKEPTITFEELKGRVKGRRKL